MFYWLLRLIWWILSTSKTGLQAAVTVVHKPGICCNFYGVKPHKLKTLSGIETPSLLTALLQTATKALKPYQGLKVDPFWFGLIAVFARFAQQLHCQNLKSESKTWNYLTDKSDRYSVRCLQVRSHLATSTRTRIPQILKNWATFSWLKTFHQVVE